MRTSGFAATMMAGLIACSMLHAAPAMAADGQLLGGLLPSVPTSQVPATQIGMNMGAPTYYSSEWVYTELFKNNADFAFNGQLDLSSLLDSAGRPTNVPVGTTLFLGIDFLGTKWRTGSYDCTLSPGWQVTSRFPGTGGTVTMADSGTAFTLTIPEPTPGYSVQLNFLATQAGATLSALACQPQGQSMLADPIKAEARADIKPFSVIRFMDWMKTNGSGQQHWADRPLPTDLSIVPRGASVEDMVDVANRLGSDPWFTLPFDADDDYVRQFATYVRDHLALGRKAYVELSNEVWNGSFRQAQDAVARGKQIYTTDFDYQAGDLYYADRVSAHMAIWNDVFRGQMFRIVRVASTQLFAPYRAELILSHNDLYKTVDAIAGAPYFGTLIDQIPGSGQARVDTFLQQLPGEAEQALQVSEQTRAIAQKYNIRFIAYEGGPAIVGFQPDAAADASTVMHDPRLHDVYLQFLQGWKSRVGDLLVLYDSVGNGYWSHKEYTGQPTEQTQKQRAIEDFEKANNAGGILGGILGGIGL